MLQAVLQIPHNTSCVTGCTNRGWVGSSASVHAGIPPPDQAPPWTRHTPRLGTLPLNQAPPPDQAPPRPGTTPRRRACWEIQLRAGGTHPNGMQSYSGDFFYREACGKILMKESYRWTALKQTGFSAINYK